MPRLTNRRLAILQQGAFNEVGRVQMPYRTGLDAVSWRRNAQYLVDQGLLEPNAHGDWYITDAGRAALSPDTGSSGGGVG